MTTIEVNGTSLYCVSSGTGVPFIVLHGGLGFDHTCMRSAFGPLSDVMRVTYLDQRGNGRSERAPIETITMRQLADDVDAVRRHLGYERIGVAGHSFGGFVALEYATSYPDGLSHLILVDTSPGTFEPTADELAERGDRGWVTPEVEAALEAMFAALPETEEGFAELLPAIAPAYVRTIDPSAVAALLETTITSVTAMRRGFEVLADWSVANDLSRITCPTLVLCGRHDLLTTPECSKRLATAIPNAELAWFEESAHFPWLEEPQAFSDAIRDFVGRHR